MSRIEGKRLLKSGGFLSLVLLVLAGLPFLRRNGYISGSTMGVTFGTLFILAGGWMIRSPEKHDHVVANEDDYPESKVRWRRIEERLGGVVAVGVGLVFIYISIS